MNFNESSTVGSFVAADYRAASVFSKYGIDFCCNGGIPISEACDKKKIDIPQLLSELQTATSDQQTESVNYQAWPADLLADFIEKKHHRYVKAQIPVIEQFLYKLCKVHGGRHPELFEITEKFTQSASELTSHMHKEENILFPIIRRMTDASLSAKENETVGLTTGSIDNPIRVMMMEHETEGARFRDIALLSNNYQAPADGCTTYRVAFEMLKDFEQDLHHHIHLENNILFPAAIRLEAGMSVLNN
jgi:regulator of cell morphogenesis and NO signaling